MLCMENLKKTLEAAGATLSDLVAATRFLTDVNDQDLLNRVWAAYLGGPHAVQVVLLVHVGQEAPRGAETPVNVALDTYGEVVPEVLHAFELID